MNPYNLYYSKKDQSCCIEGCIREATTVHHIMGRVHSKKTGKFEEPPPLEYCSECYDREVLSKLD